MDVAEAHDRVMIEAVGLKAGVGREAALILGGSLLIALAAQLHVVLPFSPVPMTGQKPWTMAASMVIGNGVIYGVGLLWLSRFVEWPAVLSTGLLPFLAGDALKIALAAILLPAGWKLIGRAGRP